MNLQKQERRRKLAVERLTATIERYENQIAKLNKSKEEAVVSNSGILTSRQAHIKALESKIKTHQTTIANTNRNLGRS